MNNFIFETLILENEFSDYSVLSTENENKRLTGLSKINILVGTNNSGKSRFMRTIALLDKPTNIPAKHFVDLQEIYTDLRNKIIDITGKANISSIQTQGGHDPLNLLESKCKFDAFSASSDNPIEFLDTIIQSFSNDNHVTYATPGYRGSRNPSLTKQIRDFCIEQEDRLNQIRQSAPKDWSYQKLYIPTLRGLRTLDESKDLYGKRTEDDYLYEWKYTSQGRESGTPRGECEVFTGQTLYSEVKELLLGDLGDRKIIIDFQSFLSRTFFNNKEVALIPRTKRDVLYIKIGDEKEYPVYELGDGIQSIIILTFPLFCAKERNLLVCIEEPELYLHPGLQRVLVETLINEFENHQFLFTTHSNHFLDLTLDYESMSVYTFRKEITDAENSDNKKAEFLIENVKNPDNNILDLIGVKNSSVFLSNCTIWVEGITDRMYFHHYLDLYQQELPNLAPRFLQDLHYSFVEYAGGNIKHWSFLDEDTGIQVDRLCGRLMLIADSDGSSKTERKKQLKAKLGKRFLLLNCKEVENLIAPEVLKKVVEEYEGEKVNFPKFGRSDYMHKYLGDYIHTQLLGGKPNRKGTYRSSSGTISQKIDFSQKVINQITCYDDLSEEAKGIAEEIYNFIKELNPR